MVLEFAIDPTAVIDMEAANPVDEPELTMHWIREKTAETNDLFQKFRSQCEQLDEFFLNDFEFSVPDSGTMIRLGTAQSVINTLVAHVSPQFLDISVPPHAKRSGPCRDNGEIPNRRTSHGRTQESRLPRTYQAGRALRDCMGES